jgi:hypothetical protein
LELPLLGHWAFLWFAWQCGFHGIGRGRCFLRAKQRKRKMWHHLIYEIIT